MTITDGEKPTSPDDATMQRRRGIVHALLIAILVLAAILVTGLTLPLLSRSTVAFFAIAGVCWAGIFAGTFLLSRSLGSRPKRD